MFGLCLLVFIGGAFGAIVREFFIILVPHIADGFPVDILLINVIASLLIGLATYHHRKKNITDEMMLFFSTGCLGGMSTFSSFVYGAYSELSHPNGIFLSILYIVGSILLGFIGVWFGLLASEITKPKLEDNV